MRLPRRPWLHAEPELLVLGGTLEARQLCDALALRSNTRATLSLAGVTRQPQATAVPTRCGGFGGPAGLAAYIRAHRVSRVIDATHPFAARMSANAAAACYQTATPLWRLERPAWSADMTDHGWQSVADAGAAARALADYGPRVFLSVGARSLAAFADVAHKYWITRSIEAPLVPPYPATHIRARPPFSLAQERALMREQAVDVLVSKNSGAPMLAAKLQAADSLGVPIIMVERPALASADRLFTRVADLLGALDAHQ